MRRARDLLLVDPTRPQPPPGVIANAFAFLDLALVVVMVLAVSALWTVLVVLSSLGSGVSWRAEFLGYFLDPPFLVPELTAICAAAAAKAQLNRWRIRWVLQGLAFLPLLFTLAWLMGELQRGSAGASR